MERLERLVDWSAIQNSINQEVETAVEAGIEKGLLRDCDAAWSEEALLCLVLGKLADKVPEGRILASLCELIGRKVSH